MKKITQSTVNGGAPIYLDDFKDVFNDEIWDIIEVLMSGYNSDTEGVIISGCEISGGGPFSISSGIVYLDGEFKRFTGSSITFPSYIQSATNVNTSRTFEDSSIQTLFITKNAELSGSAPGSGQYISITDVSDPNDRRLITAKKLLDIGDWNMNVTPLISVAHGVSDFTKIKIQSIILRNDSNSVRVPYTPVFDGSTSGIGATDITIPTSAPFSSDANFNGTGFSRGEILIEYFK